MATRSFPRMASDVFRGYTVVGIALVPGFAAQLALLYSVGFSDRVAFIIASYFVYWTFVAFIYVIVTLIVFRKPDGAELARWLRATTPKGSRARLWYLLNGGGATSWALTGSVVAVAAVLFLAFNPQYRTNPVLVYSGVGVVVGSLAMTIAAYAVTYAREYATVGGLVFPGGTEPRFADFFYLAVQVSTTFSSSDVGVTDTRTRRIVTANSLISFAFNTVILALLVSVLISST